jgi:phenylacetate-CoA ligase
VEFPISSSVAGIVWPALPSLIGAGRLGALFQMEQSQWWPQQKIRQHQFKQIDGLLRHSVQHVPYYREHLANHITAQALSEQQWLSIPLLTRNTLQQAGNELRTTVLPPGHGKLLQQRTSGSTGKPVEVLTTELNNFFWNVFSLRDTLWHHCDLTGKLAVIRHIDEGKAGPPHGVRLNNWGSATKGVLQTGICVLMNIHTPVVELAAWLEKEQPDYLQTHPSVLQELALYCQREGVQFPSLREVHTISEALPDGLRELCQAVWGAKLIDVYSTMELGYLALQCPEHEHYHVQSESVLLEVLDDDGHPCAPGQVGKVVVTSLHNFATPLIRYELGDYAEVGEPCACGRGLPVIKRILGRYRNLVTLPNGERCWPKFGIDAILKIAPVRQFQAIQHSTSEVEFLLVMKRALNTEENHKLLELFRDNLHPEMNITIREVSDIARSASGKYEEFVSRL